MRTISICGNKVKNLISDNSFVETFNMEGVTVSCGLIHTSDIEFNRDAPENARRVLLKIRAFSCNYRDKAIILTTATQAPANRINAVGSDFVGEVIDFGTEVTDLAIGDRVINNNEYPYSGVEKILSGVPTNHGSKEYRILHRAKLAKIPPEMSDQVAAAFSIGAQTSYSMIRKLNIPEKANILVTAAKSNTSLFIINALQKYRRNYGVKVYATTTSLKFADELQALGVDRLIKINPEQEEWLEPAIIREIMSETSGFDGIIDPFFDVHLSKLLPTLVIGGKYITCGLYDQYLSLVGKPAIQRESNMIKIMSCAMIHNLQIIGNCIGLTSDLENAIADYQAGELQVVIDSVYTGNQVKEFFEQTYNSRDRFGKVVYQYETIESVKLSSFFAELTTNIS